MPSYLVTGGAGFIGSNIVETLLKQGDSVRVLDDFSAGRRENLAPFFDKIELIEGDLRSPDDCKSAAEDMDYILHHGAIASVPASVADPNRSHEINATGTLNVLMAARDAKVKRLVFASSSAVYGDQKAEMNNEELRTGALSPYAATKAAGEDYVRSFSNCFELETVSLRYFNVFGPKQDPDSPYSAVIPIFIDAVLEGKRPVIHGDGLQARDFTYVENNVRANILAATGDFKAEGQTYNIACGTSFSLLELLDGINRALGTDVAPEHVASRVGDIRISKADITRAKRELNYEVVVAFDEGLTRTIEWYKAQWEKENGPPMVPAIPAR
jgi:UDP-glucose 4-epimerase